MFFLVLRSDTECMYIGTLLVNVIFEHVIMKHIQYNHTTWYISLTYTIYMYLGIHSICIHELNQIKHRYIIHNYLSRRLLLCNAYHANLPLYTLGTLLSNVTFEHVIIKYIQYNNTTEYISLTYTIYMYLGIHNICIHVSWHTQYLYAWIISNQTQIHHTYLVRILLFSCFPFYNS